MSGTDLSALLDPISGDDPCGEPLSDNAEYAALEQMLQGTPERQMGDSIIPGQEPDWREVRSQCMTLLGRSRDLRLVVYLALAEMRLRGLPGLRDSLGVLRGALERDWEGLYPKLDPTDDLDPLERMNILQCLGSAGGYGDPVMFDRRLREAPLCRSRQWGIFSLRDVAMAKGEVKPPAGSEKAPPDLKTIEAAFEETAVDELRAVSAAVNESLDHVKAIDAVLADRAGSAKTCDLTPLQKTLREIKALTDRYLSKRSPSDAGSPEASNGASAPASEPSSSGSGPRVSGDVRSQQDVMAVLESICRYYEKYEPSSPVPLMLKATRKLIGKNFSDIMKILSPDLFAQVASIAADADAQ